MNGMRSKRPPTRRQLAEATTQAIRVINHHSANEDVLKQALDTLTARVDAAWATIEQHRKDSEAHRGMSRWQRLKWLVNL